MRTRTRPRFGSRARRPRLLAMGTGLACVGTALAAGCADRASSPVTVVDVAAQPCLRPTRDRGVGFLVADGLVATAAHTVDGPRRELTVDGREAVIVALDVRLDVALLAVDVDGHPARLSTAAPQSATVVTTAGEQRVTLTATGQLTVDNVSDGTRVRREVHTFTPGVAEGTSGAPLVADDGRVVGMVQLDRDRTDLADAVTSAELARLLDGGPWEPGERAVCDGAGRAGG